MKIIFIFLSNKKIQITAKMQIRVVIWKTNGNTKKNYNKTFYIMFTKAAIY